MVINKTKKYFKIRVVFLLISLAMFYFSFNINGLFVINFFITGYFSYLLLLSVKTLIKN